MRKGTFALCCWSALVLVLSPGMMAAENAPAKPTTTAANYATGPGSESTTYRLSPGDVISVKFFLNPELNDEMQIRPDGWVSMQLIGEARLGGQTVADAVHELERRYASEIKVPRITMQIRSYAGQKVFVTGEVIRPGVVSLIGGQDVFSVIGEAGGVRQTGKSKSVILIRKGPDGHPVTRKLSLTASSEYAEPLQPYDVLIVPPRTITRIDRWVDEYIRQVIPGNLTAGFNYLYNRTSGSTGPVSVVPF